MKLIDLQNKKIGILGLGIENYALVNFLLKKKIKCEMTVCDARERKELGEKFEKLKKYKNVKWRPGTEFNKKLNEFDVLFRSPGWPLSCPGIKEFLQAVRPPIGQAGKLQNTSYKIQAILSSPMRLFMDVCPTENIIGVTGTKGKGTTGSLIAHILKQAGKRACLSGRQVWLGGNIGVAPFAFFEKIKKDDWVVLELSSFQLEDFTKSPRIAVITNFTPEHLAPADPNNPNYHKSVKEYFDAKLNIIRWQSKGDWAVLNKKLKVKSKKLKACLSGRQVGGKIIYFGKAELKSQLVGEHNKENVAAAVAVAEIAGVKNDMIKKAVASFKGLEHRLEFVGEKNGVKYYNDTFATTPEAAITALKSFPEPIVLLAGGADKGSDFKELAREIKKRVKFTVLFKGEATPRIEKELKKVGYKKEKTKIVSGMAAAADEARKVAVAGDIILLSPACASFGLFKNYKERGLLFKKEAKKAGT